MHDDISLFDYTDYLILTGRPGLWLAALDIPLSELSLLWIDIPIDKIIVVLNRIYHRNNEFASSTLYAPFVFPEEQLKSRNDNLDIIRDIPGTPCPLTASLKTQPIIAIGPGGVFYY